MGLIYYVELRDEDNKDEWSNKVDIYGYENKVLIMAMGYSKTIPTKDIDTTIKCIDDVVQRLEKADFVVINKENELNKGS